MIGRLLAGGLLGAAALALAGLWGWELLIESPPAAEAAQPPVEFRVEPGEGLGSVARRLEDEGLVVSARRFRWVARFQGVDRGVHAGTYHLPRGVDPRRLLDDLAAGRVRLLRLTIPEGWRLDRIAAEVDSALAIPAADFTAALRAPGLLERVGAESLEGYLFPDTYFFPDGVEAVDVVTALVARFEEVWATLPDTPPLGMDRHQVVTLASIVEAETPLEHEKPRVAAVYLNRLRDGWKLQADPTVRYGLRRFTGRLYFKHLDIDTPYNTYLHAGLPPGPIAAPGSAALRSVFEPLEPCDDYYFVATGDGGHRFSRTHREHERAVAEARARRDGAR